MDLMTAVVFLVIAGLGVALGLWLGSRRKDGALELARTEGRSSAAIEIARLQERASYSEQRAVETSQLVLELGQQNEGLAQRASSAETEVARLTERNAVIAELQHFLATAQSEAQNTAEALAHQRELASRLTAQIESATARIAQQEQRDGELSSQAQELREQLSERDAAIADLREITGKLRAELASAVEGQEKQQRRAGELQTECATLQERVAELRATNAELQTTVTAERANSQEKLELLMGARQDLLTQFKSLSSEILEEKSQKFTAQNADSLAQLLNPVKERLTAFQAKVEEVYRTEGQERSALGEQLKQLVQLNQTLSADAQNLARALKGDQKTQGTWGEIVLETVLEQAGLVEGTHYERQSSFDTEEQKRAVPDIVVRLPGDRQLVVDSKVSLTAYERSASATSSEDRDVHVKQHITSLRNHIRSLSEKNYQQLYQLKSLDFVLLFVPLEPAFATAIGNDNQLFRDAWERNVILVSPSTLLFVVRTVAYLWRQENQARNVIEIAKRGAALYDKLCGFVEDLEEVGKRIQQTSKSYDAALRKLAVGDGNVIRQAEMLRELGVKPSKTLPLALVDKAADAIQATLLDGSTTTGTTELHAS